MAVEGSGRRAALGRRERRREAVTENDVGPLKQADGYRTESLTIESEPGIVLPGVLGSPATGGTHPAIVWMDPAPVEAISRSPEFIRLVRAGNVIVAFHPRDVLGEPQSGPEQLAPGHYMPELLRAVVVGKTIVGMRVDDLVRVVNWICGRDNVDRQQISLYGRGGLGMAALMPQPSMSASDECSSRNISCPIARRWKPASTRTSPR